jgi:hypothetical protein
MRLTATGHSATGSESVRNPPRSSSRSASCPLPCQPKKPSSPATSSIRPLKPWDPTVVTPSTTLRHLREVSFTKTPEGTYKADVDFVTYLYDQLGKPYSVVKIRLTPHSLPPTTRPLCAAASPGTRRSASAFKGDYYLRIGVHDLTSDRVAAVEVPIATVKNLPPTPATSATATSSAIEAQP